MISFIVGGIFSVYVTVVCVNILRNFDIKASIFNLNKKSREREQILKQIREEQGNVEIKGFFNKLDILIRRSGIRVKFPWFTTELFIALEVIGFVVVYAISSRFNIPGILTIIPPMTYSFLLMFLLNFKANSMYDRLEEYIPRFIDTLIAASKHTNDITSMFRFCLNYTGGPMYGFVQEFVSTVSATKSTELAFSSFISNFENDKFVSIIRSLEITSSGVCDYDTVLTEGKEALQNFATSRETRKSNYNRGVGGISVLIFMSAGMLYCSSLLLNGGVESLVKYSVARVLLTILVGFLYFAVLKLQTMKGR